MIDLIFVSKDATQTRRGPFDDVIVTPFYIEGDGERIANAGSNGWRLLNDEQYWTVLMEHS